VTFSLWFPTATYAFNYMYGILYHPWSFIVQSDKSWVGDDKIFYIFSQAVLDKNDSIDYPVLFSLYTHLYTHLPPSLPSCLPSFLPSSLPLSPSLPLPPSNVAKQPLLALYKIWCTRNRLNLWIFYVHASPCNFDMFYFCHSLLWWPNCFVQYSCHRLRHLHWTMPFPHCTMYAEFNKGVHTHTRERETPVRRPHGTSFRLIDGLTNRLAYTFLWMR